MCLHGLWGCMTKKFSLLILLEKPENREREKFREKPQSDPDGLQIAEGEHLRWVISRVQIAK